MKMAAHETFDDLLEVGKIDREYGQCQEPLLGQ